MLCSSFSANKQGSPAIPSLCFVCVAGAISPVVRQGWLPEIMQTTITASQPYTSHVTLSRQVSASIWGIPTFPPSHPPFFAGGSNFVIGGSVTQQGNIGMGGVLQGPWGGWSAAQGVSAVKAILVKF